MTQTALVLSSYARGNLRGPAERLGGQLGRLLDRLAEALLAVLLPRPQHERLAGLSEARLRDIGLTRDTVMAEPWRPLWLG